MSSSSSSSSSQGLLIPPMLLLPPPQQSSRRQLSVEYRSVLVLRLLTGNEDSGSASIIENELNNVLFREQTEPSVQTQMRLCSGGRILLQPASEGILTVQVNLGGNTNVEAWTTAAAQKVMQEHYGTDDSVTGYKEQLRNRADHVLIILPASFPGNNFVANAEIGHSICVFTLEWIASLSAYMHEMGHNINLRHAGLGSSKPYADLTGYMGVSTPIAWGPQKCYNAAQHWSLGWYDDKRMSLVGTDLSSPITVKVAAFTDHEKIGSDYAVLVQVTDNVYLQFNRAKSYNVGTDMMPDQVVVIRDDVEKTVLLAGMDTSSNTLRLSSVAIQVCALNINFNDASQIDYAVIAVASSDNGAMCSGVLTSASAVIVATAPPTTYWPTIQPTDPPIVSPVPPPPTHAPTTVEPTTLSPSTAEPTSPPVPSTVESPTAYPTKKYVSSPHPTNQEEMQYIKNSGNDNSSNNDNPVVIKTPIFITSSATEPEDETATTQEERSASSHSSSAAAAASSSSGHSKAFLPGMLALAGVVVVTAMITFRQMSNRRRNIRRRNVHYNSVAHSNGMDLEVSSNGPPDEGTSGGWNFGGFELAMGP
jgi:Gametolysin peptidase M11